MKNVSSSQSAASVPTVGSGALVSDEIRLIIQGVNFAIICEIIDVFGTVTNIINIIVFVKQGFSDPVNVSLLGLAVSDLCCLATLLWHNICHNPLFQALDLPFDPLDIQYLTGGMPHVTFTHVTAWITAFITFERCLCITIPLKVKNVITSKRVFIVLVILYVVLIASVTPVYIVNSHGPKFFPKRNKTLIGLVYAANREEVEEVFFAVKYVFVPFTAFFIVIICTVIVVVKLRSKSKWRNQFTGQGGKADNFSSRDQKVTKMVTMISTMFIVCFTPIVVMFLGMSIEPELSMDGKYRNLLFIMFSCGYILESTNSSLNIFIYYEMSSKYRAVFNQIFRRKKDTTES